jgi:hypothetical protein
LLLCCHQRMICQGLLKTLPVGMIDVRHERLSVHED